MAEASRLVVVRTVLIQHTVRFHVADIAFGCPFLDVHRLHQFGYEFSVRDFLPASEDFFYDALQLFLFPFLLVFGRLFTGRYVHILLFVPCEKQHGYIQRTAVTDFDSLDYGIGGILILLNGENGCRFSLQLRADVSA